jgi:hypothetical protein
LQWFFAARRVSANVLFVRYVEAVMTDEYNPSLIPMVEKARD